MTRNQRFGAERERAVKKLLEADGWFVTKAGGSLGVADLVALKAGHQPRLIQIKGTARGPFSDFGPDDRAKLRLVALDAGAVAELAWWPCRKPCAWLLEPTWPNP